MNQNEKLKSVWEDCCDLCKEQETCDILIARCLNTRGKVCDACRVCDDFVALPVFKRMDENVRLKK